MMMKMMRGIFSSKITLDHLTYSDVMNIKWCFELFTPAGLPLLSLLLSPSSAAVRSFSSFQKKKKNISNLHLMESVLKRGTKVKGILIDIHGVLYESGNCNPITGSVEAVHLLIESGLPFRFVTNESQKPRADIIKKLSSFGYDSIKIDHIYSPAPAVRQYLIKNQLRPHFLVHPDILPEFDGLDTSDPVNCVVMGDAGKYFSYEAMNSAFRTLINMKPSPKLISMGYGKYFKENNHLVIDVGAYAAALEYACDTKSIVIGKPDKDFYDGALDQIRMDPSDTVMIGDDLISDVGGSQKLGMSGILVKTGKFRPERDLNHPNIKPDYFADNFLAAIIFIMSHNEKCSQT